MIQRLVNQLAPIFDRASSYAGRNSGQLLRGAAYGAAGMGALTAFDNVSNGRSAMSGMGRSLLMGGIGGAALGPALGAGRNAVNAAYARTPRGMAGQVVRDADALIASGRAGAADLAKRRQRATIGRRRWQDQSNRAASAARLANIKRFNQGSGPSMGAFGKFDDWE